VAAWIGTSGWSYDHWHPLRWWADRIGEWNRAGQNVFVYFNNDENANAVRNALTLRALLDE
jgi:uncharacterized protein YecE (DUF72 family)